MQIARTLLGNAIELAIDGRLDGVWAEHLDTVIAEVVREGHHEVRLNLARVSLLTSAGVGVLAKHYQRLSAIGGSLIVVSPSPAVDRVLRVARLADRLLAAEAEAADPLTQSARRLVRDGTAFDIFDLDPSGSMTVEEVGDPGQPRTAGGGWDTDVSLGSRSPLFALAVGAFGSSFADCAARYGEMLSVAGATMYQPAGGATGADYLVSEGALPSDVRVLYGLVCEGRPRQLIRFEPMAAPQEAGASVPGAGTGAIGLGRLLAFCTEAAGTSRIGAVIVAESSGLVGASLRQSPAAVAAAGENFFEHPGIRSRLTFTAEPAFARTLVLAAAIVSTPDAAEDAAQLRPIAPELVGHAHAAAFAYRPLRKRRIDLRETVASILEGEALVGVLHLLRDDRASGGAGESQFVRGACWIAPIQDPVRRGPCSC